MSTLELCNKYFGTRDIYELLKVGKDATGNEIKKAYYKLSLQVHPDRCQESEKEAATQKFQVLSKLYQVISDKTSRAIYDEHGTIEEEDDEINLSNWIDLWRKIFQPLTMEDITNYEKSYRNSEMERHDIKKAYLNEKGCINHMMDDVPFLKTEDEDRLQKIVREMIDAGEVPEYKIFTKEPAAKRKRRHQKYARYSKQAEKFRQEMDTNDSLQQQLVERQRSREDNYNSLIDKLAEKYCGKDDHDNFKINGNKKRAQKKSPKKAKNSVKGGKVNKRKN